MARNVRYRFVCREVGIWEIEDSGHVYDETVFLEKHRIPNLFIIRNCVCKAIRPSFNAIFIAFQMDAASRV